jgi:hypothetical protein
MREFAPINHVCCGEKNQKSQLEGLEGTLGYGNAFSVSSLGRSGGIVIFLNNKIN